MQAVAGELTVAAGHRAGQVRDVDVGRIGLAVLALRHGVELVDFSGNNYRVAAWALAVERLPLVGNREHHHMARPPAGKADGLLQQRPKLVAVLHQALVLVVPPNQQQYQAVGWGRLGGGGLELGRGPAGCGRCSRPRPRPRLGP